MKVNGVRVAEKFLVPGDERAVARHRFKISYTPLSNAPPPEEEDGTKVSLLDKAGLSSKRPRPSSAKKKPPPDSTKKSGLSPEEEALRWLEGDEDE